MICESYTFKTSLTCIYYNTYQTSFGRILIATTEANKLFALEFCDLHRETFCLEQLCIRYRTETIIKDNYLPTKSLSKIFEKQVEIDSFATLPIILYGTEFQRQVWQALLKIPRGRLVSYEYLAKYLGKSTAIRAVASAVANNPIAYLIPCHRVIRKTGEFGEYRWGREMKRRLIMSEHVQNSYC